MPGIRKGRFGLNLIWILRIIIFVAGPILLAVLIAANYNIYPKQYWFTKGIFWIVFFSCMAAFGLCRRDLLGRFERAIYKIIFFLPLLFLAFLLIPFMGIGVGLIFYVKFIGDDKFILYNDSKIRIEQPYIRFMGPDPKPVIYVKRKLTCYQDTTLPIGYNNAKDKVEVLKNGDSTYLITFKSPDNWKVPTGTQTFYYTMKSNDR